MLSYLESGYMWVIDSIFPCDCPNRVGRHSPLAVCLLAQFACSLHSTSWSFHSLPFQLLRHQSSIQKEAYLDRISIHHPLREHASSQDIFNTTEEDVIAQYNSSLYIPQIVFLGLDEREGDFVYKEHYKGQPWFAVDVSPKEDVKEAAEALIKKVEDQGHGFSKGRMHMSLPAEEGTSPPPPNHKPSQY